MSLQPVIGSIVFSSISNPNTWDIGEHKKLVFSSPSEAKRGEELFKSMQDALDAKDARIKELEGIILWALGENGEFPDIPENWDALKYKPMYYWRKEMRVRFDRAREALK